MTRKRELGKILATPPGFMPYVFHGTMLGDRKGQPCALIDAQGTYAHIRFSDGYDACVPRLNLRRRRGNLCPVEEVGNT